MKEVLQRAGTTIRAWGYRGSGQNYRRHAGGVIFVINFQKSRSGDCFFVNLGGQPIAIPDEGENEPNVKTLKEYECVFRHRLRGEWRVCMSPAQIDALMADVDATRRTFERKVDEMRELSRQGRGRDLFDGRGYTGPAPRAALILGRLLAADGHASAARVLAEQAVADAGEARLLRAAAQRLLAGLPDP